MKILIVVYEDYHHSSNHEAWLFDTDEPLNLNWPKYKVENPDSKLFQYLELMGGTLLNFEELII